MSSERGSTSSSCFRFLLEFPRVGLQDAWFSTEESRRPGGGGDDGTEIELPSLSEKGLEAGDNGDDGMSLEMRFDLGVW